MPLSSGNERKLWLDGYNGERCVLFDEFRGQIPIDPIKIICDQYSVQTPFKGGFVPWICDVVCFTSQVHPDSWWLDDDYVTEADRRAFAARCVIVEFDEVLEAATNRLAASRRALGADFEASLPRNAREVPSIWLSTEASGGRSNNLRVPDLQRNGGLPPPGVPVCGVQVQPRTLEDRLQLLQPGYVTGPQRLLPPS